MGVNLAAVQINEVTLNTRRKKFLSALLSHVSEAPSVFKLFSRKQMPIIQ
jgi:hypothetical protein